MLQSKARKKAGFLEKFGKIKEDSFYFEHIEQYFRKRPHTDSFHVLTDKTCNDLDLNELYMFIDRTESKIGQQFLYDRLRTIPSNSNESILHENLISEFTDNPEFRVTIQSQLSKLNTVETFYITNSNRAN